LGGTQPDLMASLREWDARLDKLEASTQGGPRYAGAMERGSAEAYSTILNAGRDSRNIARDQLREARRTNEHLEDIARQEPEQTVSIGA
jgi:hypothetical protein